MQAATRLELDKVDLLLVPTVLHHYTVAEIEQEEKGTGKVMLLLDVFYSRLLLLDAAFERFTDLNQVQWGMPSSKAFSPGRHKVAESFDRAAINMSWISSLKGWPFLA